MDTKTREQELREIRVREHAAASWLADRVLDARQEAHREGSSVIIPEEQWREILVAFREYRHARWDWEDFMDRGGGVNGKTVRRVREYDGRRILTPYRHPWSR